mmetsp:Transcript_161786/g.518967  ORF Transcript_161786/g.518967 Transcript_161786/m.518967 type:complete len:774 (-) Transcript_161786:23-2344(-)
MALAPAAHREERWRLEDRVHRLTEECNALEFETAARRSQTSDGESTSLAALMRERDDLHQRLKAAELVRSAAESRFSTAESALRRALDELSSRRWESEQADAAQDARDRDVEELKRELAAAQASRDDVDRALAKKREQIHLNEREQEEVHVEHDALVSANDALRQDIAGIKERIETESRRLKGSEAEATELRARARLKELDFGTEIEAFKKQAQHLEEDTAKAVAACESSEAAAAKDRIESLEAQGELDDLLVAQREVQAQEHRSAEGREREAAELRRRAEQLAAERGQLARRLSEVQAATQQLHAQEQEELGRCELEARNLARERSKAEEMCLRSHSEVRAAEQRVESLMAQLSEERQHNHDRSREIAAAREAAGEASGTPPWRAPAAMERRLLGTERPSDERARGLEMQRELDLLQRWKGDAMGLLHRMQMDMSSVQEQYRQQLENNQELQERLEKMGQQARAAVSGMPPAPSYLASPPLSAPARSAPERAPPLQQRRPVVPAAGSPSWATEPIGGGLPGAGFGGWSSPSSWGTAPSGLGLGATPSFGSFGGLPPPSAPAGALGAGALPGGHGGGLGLGALGQPGLLAGPDLPERPDVPAPRRPSLPSAAAFAPGDLGGLCGAGGAATQSAAEAVAAAAAAVAALPGGGAYSDDGALPAFSESWHPYSTFGPGGGREDLDGPALLAAQLSVPAPGPVGGPFYDAFRMRTSADPQQVVAARLSAASPVCGPLPRRRRRSAAAPTQPRAAAAAAGRFVGGVRSASAAGPLRRR